jgi:hypothetical protein
VTFCVRVEICPLTTAPRLNCSCQSARRLAPLNIAVSQQRAEAIRRYAVEDLPALRSLGAWMHVGDERFNSDEIYRLYEGSEYPSR